jgi:hypothetical protein
MTIGRLAEGKIVFKYLARINLRPTCYATEPWPSSTSQPGYQKMSRNSYCPPVIIPKETAEALATLAG